MIKQKLQEDQIIALKSKNTEKLNLIRYILAQIKNKEIEKRADLTDEETIQVFRKIVKEFKESIEGAEKAKRQDLIDQNKKQLAILTVYMPPEISDEELKKEIKQVIEKNKELYQKNPKAIMGIAVKELKNKAEPSRIIKIIQGV